MDLGKRDVTGEDRATADEVAEAGQKERRAAVADAALDISSGRVS
jgi:hypothetical protein